jgi:hypothetical protein
MGLNNCPSFKANGTIGPSRFVVVDSAGDNLLLEASSTVTPTGGAISGTNVPIIGVSQVGQKRTPGLPGSDVTIAAAQGDVLQIYTFGDVAPIQVAGTVIAGDLLKTNGTTDGKALAVAPSTAYSAVEVGGRALQAGVVGQLVMAAIFSRKA